MMLLKPLTPTITRIIYGSYVEQTLDIGESESSTMITATTRKKVVIFQFVRPRVVWFLLGCDPRSNSLGRSGERKRMLTAMGSLWNILLGQRVFPRTNKTADPHKFASFFWKMQAWFFPSFVRSWHEHMRICCRHVTYLQAPTVISTDTDKSAPSAFLSILSLENYPAPTFSPILTCHSDLTSQVKK